MYVAGMEEIVEQIKHCMRTTYSPIEIENFFWNWGDHSVYAKDDGLTFVINQDGFRVETTTYPGKFQKHGYITVFQSDDLKEVIPFSYSVGRESE